MGVDYEQLLKDNEAAKQGEIKQVNDSYSQTASNYQTEVDDQLQDLEDYEAEQKDLLKEQQDLAIEQINQQKEQAEKDYIKEQQAAYGDYKRQTDPFGVNAEQMASLGLSRSGYSESSNVAMYTAYQNRVATARASIEQARQTYTNMINEAKLTNDINLAKIAAETLEKRVSLAMESVIRLGNLELQKAEAASAIDQTYYNRAQDIRDAQKEAMGSGTFSITGDEGNADFTAVDTFFGDSVSDEAVAQMIADGIITVETVNGVDVYKVADEEKARAYMAGQTGTTAQGGAEGGIGGSQTEQPKYNYSDERVNAYFTKKDAVEQLRKEYNNALYNLEALKQQPNGALTLAQEEYVTKVRKQLLTANGELLSMQKPTESSTYLRWDNECKKAKEVLEAAKRELASLQGSGVSAGALRSAEEKVRNAKKAFDKAYAALMSVDRYEIQEKAKGMSDYVGTFRTDRLK